MSVRTVHRAARTNGFNSEHRVPTARTSGSPCRHIYATTHSSRYNGYPTLLRPLRLLLHFHPSPCTTLLAKQELLEDDGLTLLERSSFGALGATPHFFDGVAPTVLFASAFLLGAFIEPLKV